MAPFWSKINPFSSFVPDADEEEEGESEPGTPQKANDRADVSDLNSDVKRGKQSEALDSLATFTFPARAAPGAQTHSATPAKSDTSTNSPRKSSSNPNLRSPDKSTNTPSTSGSRNSTKHKRSMSLLRSLSISPRKNKSPDKESAGIGKENVPLPSPASVPLPVSPSASNFSSFTGTPGQKMGEMMGMESPAAEKASRILNQTFERSRTAVPSQSTTPPSSPPANLSARLIPLPSTPSNIFPSFSQSNTNITAATPAPALPSAPPSIPQPPRSILRPPQTPGTGQSVRFNGHSAFRIISPNTSLTSSTSSSAANVSLSLQMMSDDEAGEGSMTTSRIEDLSVDRLLSMSMREESLMDVSVSGTGFEREGTPLLTPHSGSGSGSPFSGTPASGAVSASATPSFSGTPARAVTPVKPSTPASAIQATPAITITPARPSPSPHHQTHTPISAQSSRAGTLPPPILTPQTQPLFDSSSLSLHSSPIGSGENSLSHSSGGVDLECTNLNALDLSRALRAAGVRGGGEGSGSGMGDLSADGSADGSGEGGMVVPPWEVVSPAARRPSSLGTSPNPAALITGSNTNTSGASSTPHGQEWNRAGSTAVSPGMEEAEEGIRSACVSMFESPSVERSIARLATAASTSAGKHASVLSYSGLQLGEGEALIITNPDEAAPPTHSQALEQQEHHTLTRADISEHVNNLTSNTSSPSFLQPRPSPTPAYSPAPSSVSAARTPARGQSPFPSPLASTPDATAYLSVADWSGELPSPVRLAVSPSQASPSVLAQAQGHAQGDGGEEGESPAMRRAASMQSLGLGRQPARSPDASQAQAPIEGSSILHDTSPTTTTTTTTTNPNITGSSRVFSRTAQPMQGIIAAISTSREHTTPSPDKSLALPGKFRWEWDLPGASPSPSPSSSSALAAANAAYNTTLGEKSLMLPGKFRWDSGSLPGTPSPASRLLPSADASGSRQGIKSLASSTSSESSFSAISSLQLDARASSASSHSNVESQLGDSIFSPASSHGRQMMLDLREQSPLFFDLQGQEEREEIKHAVSGLVADLRELVSSDQQSLRESFLRLEGGSTGEKEEELRREVERLSRALREAEERMREDAARRVVLEQDVQEVQLRSERERASLLREVEEIQEALNEQRAQEEVVQQKEEEIGALREELAAALERERELRDSTPRASPTFPAASASPSAAVQEELQRQLDEKEKQLADYSQKLREQTAALNSAQQKIGMLDAEVQAQWAGAEKATDKIQQLERDKKAILADLQRFQAERQQREVESREQKHELAAKLSEAWAAKARLEGEKDELATALSAAQEELEDVKSELAQLREQYEEEHHELQNVQEAYDALQDASQAVIHEREEATAARERLEKLVHEQDEDLASTTMRIMQNEKENDVLRGEMAQLKRDYERELAIQARKLDEAVRRAEEAEQAKNDMIRRKAMEDLDMDGWKSQLQVLKDENSGMRKQLHDLQTHMRDKELEVERLKKTRDEIKEDKEGLNLALEAKQQELDLLKRKFGVKGVAGGNTPATIRTVRPASRESLPFSTPAARAPSREGKDRRTTLGAFEPLKTSALKVPPTAETTRASRRSSILATPTPASTASAALPKPHASDLKPAAAPTSRRTSMPSAVHRRLSSGSIPTRTGFGSSMRASSNTLQSVEDKENEDPVEDVLPKAVRRRTLVAA